MKIKLNKITEYQERQCKLFAEYSVDSSIDEYKSRMQSNRDKIKKDIYNGKIAEFMVYNYLFEAGKYPSSPDLNIYKSVHKSYECDLYVKEKEIHVKSHKKNDKYPVSWLFQKNDPIIKNKIGFICFVVMGENNAYMYLVKSSKVLYRSPIKKALKKNKACVYEYDLTK